MFYLLKNFQSCNLKLKCNNLIFNEILVLYASYVCLLHSRFIENHQIWILENGPLISKVVLSQPSTTCSAFSQLDRPRPKRNYPVGTPADSSAALIHRHPGRRPPHRHQCRLHGAAFALVSRTHSQPVSSLARTLSA
jgi:hypothetical protein